MREAWHANPKTPSHLLQIRLAEYALKYNRVGFSVFFLSLILASSVLAGEQVEIISPTPIYSKSAGRVQKIDVAQPRQRYEIVGQSRSGTWLRIDYKGKSAWVRTQDVARIEAWNGKTYPRGVAQQGKARRHRSQWAIDPSLGLQTNDYGFALGLGGFYRLPIRSLPPEYRIDAGLAGYFLPSVNTGSTAISASAFEVLGIGRFLANIMPELEVGGEAGFAWIHVSTSSTTLAVTNAGSTLTGLLGGVAATSFSPGLHALAGIRLLLGSGTAFLFHAGIEYRF